MNYSERYLRNSHTSDSFILCNRKEENASAGKNYWKKKKTLTIFENKKYIKIQYKLVTT